MDRAPANGGHCRGYGVRTKSLPSEWQPVQTGAPMADVKVEPGVARRSRGTTRCASHPTMNRRAEIGRPVKRGEENSGNKRGCARFERATDFSPGIHARVSGRRRQLAGNAVEPPKRSDGWGTDSAVQPR